MRTIIVTLFAATLAFTAVGTADAAMKMMMHHKMHFKHHGMACKGMFMYMDMKAHKCKDATA